MTTERKTLKPFLVRHYPDGTKRVFTPDGKQLPYIESVDIVGHGEHELAVIKALWFTGDEYDLLKPYTVDGKLLHYDGESYAIIQSGIDVSVMAYNMRVQYTFALIPVMVTYL